MRRLVLLVLVAAAGSAAARPPPEPEPTRSARPPLEWSTWFRFGVGMEAGKPTPTAARSTQPPLPRGEDTTWEAALGADITLGIDRAGDVRFGAWGEIRGLSAVGGAEIVITAVPKSIDMFLFEGQGILAIRAGGNHRQMTAAVAYGYLAPWRLWGPWRGATRYMIGVRFVASYTRAIDDPRDWTATLGLETEPFGALRYLLGIRSLY